MNVLGLMALGGALAMTGPMGAALDAAVGGTRRTSSGTSPLLLGATTASAVGVALLEWMVLGALFSLGYSDAPNGPPPNLWWRTAGAVAVPAVIVVLGAWFLRRRPVSRWLAGTPVLILLLLGVLALALAVLPG